MTIIEKVRDTFASVAPGTTFTTQLMKLLTRCRKSMA